MADRMILGEKYDDYYGFDCDNYDPYDPFEEHCEEICRETADAMLFSQIRAEFGADAEDIIMDIILGESVDAAIQKSMM